MRKTGRYPFVINSPFADAEMGDELVEYRNTDWIDDEQPAGVDWEDMTEEEEDDWEPDEANTSELELVENFQKLDSGCQCSDEQLELEEEIENLEYETERDFDFYAYQEEAEGEELEGEDEADDWSTIDDEEIRELLSDDLGEIDPTQDWDEEMEDNSAFDAIVMGEDNAGEEGAFQEIEEIISNQSNEVYNLPPFEQGIFDKWGLADRWSEALKQAQFFIDRIKSMTYIGLANIPGEHSIGFVQIKVRDSEGVFRKKELSLHSRVKDLTFYQEGSTLRERFTLLDYPYAGQIGTVRARPNAQSRFTKALYLPGAVVRFDESSHTLTIDGIPGFSVTTGTMEDPTEDRLPKLAKGRYKLLFPAYPSKYGAKYLPLSEYARVWFQIEDEYVGTDKGRYLHPGKVSHSCITVGENFNGNPDNAHGTDDDIKKWTTIYSHLITRRINHKYVGELIIT